MVGDCVCMLSLIVLWHLQERWGPAHMHMLVRVLEGVNCGAQDGRVENFGLGAV